MKTRNILAVILIIFIATACQDKSQKPREELKALRTTLAETQKRIVELEEILNNDSSKVESNTVFVDLIKIKPDTFIHYITITGSVKSDNQAFISPEINGQIKKVLVKEGQRVKKGQSLVILNSEITQNYKRLTFFHSLTFFY